MAAMAGSPGYCSLNIDDRNMKIWMICVAYEAGVGKGKTGRYINPYEANTLEHIAWNYGYEFGIESKKSPTEENQVNKLLQFAGNLPTFSGKWQHYKGGLYQIIGVGRHSETGEPMVFYRNEENGTVWGRPAKMWQDKVFWHDKEHTRFVQVSSEQSELSKLIDEVRALGPMTTQQVWDQRVSFAFGHLPKENKLTIEEVKEILTKIYGPRPQE